jgi:hypothetical protein
LVGPVIAAAGVLGVSPQTWWPGCAEPCSARPRLAGVSSLRPAAFNRAALPSGDEPHYLATQSLLIDRPAHREQHAGITCRIAGRLRPDYPQRGADGQIYWCTRRAFGGGAPAFAVAGTSAP